MYSHGEGPGEFVQPARAGFRGDSLWVSDPGNGRITVFAPGVRSARTISFAITDPSGRFRTILPGSLLADGSLLATPGLDMNEAATREELRLPVLRVDERGEVRDTLAWRAVRREAVRFRIGTARGDRLQTRRHPIPGSAQVVLGPGGTTVFVVDPEPPESRGFQVTHIAIGGDTLKTFVVEIDRPEIEEGHVEGMIREEYRGLTYLHDEVSEPRFAADYMDALTLPEIYLALRGVLVDPAGRLWVQPHRGQPTEWHAVDHARRELGRCFTLTEGLDVKEIGRELIWAVEEDDLSVPYVVGLELR